jgi:hypothetical protein
MDFAAVALATPYCSTRVRTEGIGRRGASSPEVIWARRMPASCQYTGSSHSRSIVMRQTVDARGV